MTMDVFRQSLSGAKPPGVLILTSPLAPIGAFYRKCQIKSWSGHLHIAIHRHGHELVGLEILELHDLMPGAGELAPAG